MKPKQSEDENLFRINGYFYRFVVGVPGVPARLDGRGASRSMVYVITRPATSLNKVSFALHWTLMLQDDHR
jgi:hypothetical protein